MKWLKPEWKGVAGGDFCLRSGVWEVETKFQHCLDFVSTDNRCFWQEEE